MGAEEEDVAIYHGNWGSWKPFVGPRGGYYACGAQVRFEDPIRGDDTAANGLRLKFCHYTNWNDQKDWMDIYPGVWGGWKEQKMCPYNKNINGAQVRYEDNQGSGDDTTLNGLAIRCVTKDGKSPEWMTVYSGVWGSWKSQVYKTGKLVAQAKIRFEDPIKGDDTAWNGLIFKYEVPEKKGLGEKCERSSECKSGLTCRKFWYNSYCFN